MVVEQSGPGGGVSQTVARIDTQRYSPDCIALEVTSTAGCPLVITNNYSHYWSAWIDGKRQDVFPADQTFQGVKVPPGEHRVELEYAPPYAPPHCR